MIEMIGLIGLIDLTDSGLGVLVALSVGLIVVYFGAELLPMGRRHMSPLQQARMVLSVLWIGIVCAFYVVQLIDKTDDAAVAKNISDCNNSNANRLSRRGDFEERISLIKSQIEEAENTPPLDSSSIPGYGAYDDVDVQLTIDGFLAIIDAGRVDNLADLEEDLALTESQYLDYKSDFPLLRCEGDPVNNAPVLLPSVTEATVSD